MTPSTAPVTAPTTDTRSTKANGLVLAAFRVVVSFLFGCHGLQGFGMFGGIDGQGTPVPFGSFPGWWGSVLELVCSALVLVGVAVRPAALLCSGAMAYAYFVVHQPTGLLPLQNLGEPAAVYSWSFLLIAVLGPGSYTLARAFRR
ncbi:DoxX family protein [Saccharothrix australiensis]|uniref:Putative oxidoreductase n=1 Tax=Saccharothrix australiensis TaxID=2072 RepID=A0A495W6J3_9PSEU|nr:DoxX family protein [Saccharothrix australiensis]RKT57341.1 putative oxidoreductase [Saccharothrix australiensis]